MVSALARSLEKLIPTKRKKQYAIMLIVEIFGKMELQGREE